MTHEEELQRLMNKLEDLGSALDLAKVELDQARTKNTELWTELLALRREAEQGFNYYPGPSSHCVICECALSGDVQIAHGLCESDKENFDQLHPGARLNPQARG